MPARRLKLKCPLPHEILYVLFWKLLLLGPLNYQVLVVSETI
jgi:hypothetical protein